MPKLVDLALIVDALALLLSVPCILHATPLTMVLFFFSSLPLFGLGFLLYMVAVIRDLRLHRVL
jgi:hypothetical protein